MNQEQKVVLISVVDHVLRWLIVTTIIAGLALMTGYAVSAPAPLVKRERRKMAAPLPASCIMYMFSVGYVTTFSPDGNYSARRVGADQPLWEGSWTLSRTEAGGWVLVIHERMAGWNAWLIHVIPLDGNRRRGVRDWQDCFSLEVKP